MKSSAWATVAAWSALALATAAGAASVSEEATTRKIVREYSACVVKLHGEQAATAVMSNADNSVIERQFSNLIDSSCLGSAMGSGELKFKGDQFRYSVANALVSARLSSPLSGDFSDRMPLAHLPAPDRAAFDRAILNVKSKRQREQLQKSFDTNYGVAWLSRYGECVVRQDPAKAQRWLLTHADTPEEISRINDLRPAFSNCLGEGTMKFNRTTMRGTVAINYYRLAMATRVPGSVR